MKRKILTIMAMVLMVALCVVGIVACKPTEKPDPKPETKLEQYDMSGVTFTDKTVTYTGEAQTVTVSGTLPAGVTVTYEHFSGETKLESAPVNVGTYKVVAKFTGDDKHEAVADKTATLTINRAAIEVVLGATTESTATGDVELETPIEFTKNDDGSFTHQYDGKQYYVEIVSSNVDLDALTFGFYGELNEDGTVNEDSEGGSLIAASVGSTIYVLVTMDEEDPNYYPSLLTTLTVEKRVVEISTAEELQLIRTEVKDVELSLRLNTVYKLVADIDLENASWQAVTTDILSDKSFMGEFDGQGYTIKNFVIDEYNTTAEEIVDSDGISFGFFGWLSDAYIHDVKFADFKVDISLEKLAERGYTNQAFLNPLYFGIIAGRTDAPKQEIGTRYENVTVENADIYFEAYKGYVGTFMGNDYSAGSRKNLDATNVTILGMEKGPGGQQFTMGGVVGDLKGAATFEDCDVSGITLILGGKDNEFVRGDKIYLGGLLGSNRSSVKPTFTNCTVTNFRLENWASNIIGKYLGINNITVVGAEAEFIDCDARADDDETYGLFTYTYNEGEQRWEKTVVDWKEPQAQD